MGQRLASAEATEWSRKMFSISLQLEGKDGNASAISAVPSHTPSAPALASVHKAVSLSSIMADPESGKGGKSVQRAGGEGRGNGIGLAAVNEGDEESEGSSRPPLPKKKFFSFRKSKTEATLINEALSISITPTSASAENSYDNVAAKRKIDRQQLLGNRSEIRKKNL